MNTLSSCSTRFLNGFGHGAPPYLEHESEQKSYLILKSLSWSDVTIPPPANPFGIPSQVLPTLPRKPPTLRWPRLVISRPPRRTTSLLDGRSGKCRHRRRKRKGKATPELPAFASRLRKTLQALPEMLLLVETMGLDVPDLWITPQMTSQTRRKRAGPRRRSRARSPRPTSHLGKETTPAARARRRQKRKKASHLDQSLPMRWTP